MNNKKFTRAFIAIALNNQICNELGDLQQKLSRANADIKWVNPENIHITLRFLGNIINEQINNIIKIMQSVAKNQTPFHIHLASIGAFPEIEYPKVMWVDMDSGVNETKAIYVNIENELLKLGFEKEKRPFNPHITLGRLRSNKNKSELIKLMQKEKSFSSNEKLLINEIILYKSILSPKGPVYEPIVKTSLTAT